MLFRIRRYEGGMRTIIPLAVGLGGCASPGAKSTHPERGGSFDNREDGSGEPSSSDGAGESDDEDDVEEPGSR